MSKYFKCIPNKSPLTFKCGEKISIEVFARDRCRNTECKYIRWEILGDDGKSQKGLGGCTANKPLVIETTLDKPGFVHLICKAITSANTADTSFEPLDASFGAEIEKIEYHDQIPDDFCEYWQNIEDMIENSPIQSTVVSQKDGEDGFEVYDMRVNTPEGRPASFIITVPKADGKYPVKAHFMGYGVNPAYALYNENCITAYFNAHGIENHLTKLEIDEKYGKELKEGYGFENDKNASNMTTYWRSVMIRGLMGVKYLKTLPKWDGNNLIIAGGSQGAFQATNIAAHTKGATLLQIGIPWFCDLNAISKGFLRGWRPDFAQGLRYFDTAAQGKFVECPVMIDANLGDYVCPPSGVMALYNGIKTQKSITFTQSATHGYAPNERERFTLSFDPKNPSGEFKKGIYRHFKGNEYEVIDIAYNCENCQETVVYKALYGEGKLWTRPKDEFCDFVVRNGKMQKRFEFVK